MTLAFAFWSQFAELLFLLLLGAMIWSAVAYHRVRGGGWPVILGWSALVAFAMQAVLMTGAAYQSSVPDQATPNLPVSYEIWELIGAVASLLLGIALLLGGISLVYLGWLEGNAASSGKRGRKAKPKTKAKRKRA